MEIKNHKFKNLFYFLFGVILSFLCLKTASASTFKCGAMTFNNIEDYVMSALPTTADVSGKENVAIYCNNPNNYNTNSFNIRTVFFSTLDNLLFSASSSTYALFPSNYTAPTSALEFTFNRSGSLTNTQFYSTTPNTWAYTSFFERFTANAPQLVTNFSLTNLTVSFNYSNYTVAQIDEKTNVLDFSDYFFPSSLTYNPNVLDTNTDFKKECLNNQNTYFSVLPTDIDTLNTSADFPINNYFISPYLLDNFYINFLSFNSNDTNYSISNNNFTSMYYKFNTYDSVHDFSSLSSNVFNDFNTLYPSLYQSLYGYTLFNTYMSYTSSTGYFTTQVYHLSNAYSSLPLCSTVGGSTVCITDNGTIHGGGGRDHDTIIETPTQNTCFYIPIDYEIKIWDVNEFNDINDNINIGGTDYDITTTVYEEDYTSIMNNSSYSGFLGYFTKSIDVLLFPISIVSGTITKFFNTFPLIIQYIIIGVISLGFIFGIIKFLTGGK